MFQACGDTASRLAGCGISRRAGREDLRNPSPAEHSDAANAVRIVVREPAGRSVAGQERRATTKVW